MRRLLLLAIPLMLVGAPLGCQKATRYPAVAAKKADDKVQPKAIWGWITPDKTPRDLPIRFVSSDQPAWKSLPEFWNNPSPALGMRSLIHIGQPPLAVAAALSLIDENEAVAIKVPLGLPDPTPLIPAANPPTFGKWKLGRRLFFEKILTAGREKYACVDCHKPDHGFAETNRLSLEGSRNTLSLVNAVYNRSQFWDGRVRDLEEVLFHSISDELEGGAPRAQVLSQHHWGGVARFLDADPVYREEFKQVFGIPRVTQDAVAKSLATYLRTILSGDSLYDKASALSPNPTPEHFKAVLGDDAVKRLARAVGAKETLDADELSRRIAHGRDVFFGSAGCATCHSGPTFTNGTYANVLVGDSDLAQRESGKETGRFTALPIGLKNPAMRGAYRVPTLRNLSSTWPYFHDGSRRTVSESVDYFGKHLNPTNPLLAPELRELLDRTPSPIPGLQPFLFNPDEHDSLLVFLLALDGQPVSPIVTKRP